MIQTVPLVLLFAALVIALECRGVAARRRALRDLPLDERDDIDERPLHEA